MVKLAIFAKRSSKPVDDTDARRRTACPAALEALEDVVGEEDIPRVVCPAPLNAVVELRVPRAAAFLIHVVRHVAEDVLVCDIRMTHERPSRPIEPV